MSEADLGYPGMRPLGYSYGIGQSILHVPGLAADPSDPGMPGPDSLLGFFEAVVGQSYDKTGWQPSDFDTARARARTPAVLPFIRALWGAYLNNGPIPLDEEYASPSGGGVWSSADAIKKERHVYFYASQEDYGGQAYSGAAATGPKGLSVNAALYLQIEGYSDNTKTWVLPRIGGSQVWAYRYEADHAGAPYNGNWKGVVSFVEWGNDNAQTIDDWIIAVIGTILTIVTAGAASAAMAGALIAVGVSAAVASASAASLVAALDAVAIGAVKFAVTGDSTQLMAALVQAGNVAVSLAPEAVDALAKKFPDQAKFLTDVAAQVKGVADDAEKLAGSSIASLGTYMASAQKLCGTFPIINEDYWNTAKLVVGGQFTTGGYFLTEARRALDPSQLQNVFDAAPWYAKGFVQYAATIRAAELAQTAVWNKQAGYGMHAPSVKFDPGAVQAMMPPQKAADIAGQVVLQHSKWPPTPPPSAFLGKGKAPGAVLVLGLGAVLAKILGLF